MKCENAIDGLDNDDHFPIRVSAAPGAVVPVQHEMLASRAVVPPALLDTRDRLSSFWPVGSWDADGSAFLCGTAGTTSCAPSAA